MSTPLGGGSGSQIITNVYNSHASTTIAKGEVVELDITGISAGAPSMDGMTGDRILEVVPNTVADDSLGNAGITLGIALEEIEAGKFGHICMWGLVLVLGDDTAAVGVVVGVDASTPVRTSDAANATFQAPHGIQMETGVQAALKWVFVDFLSSRFGGSAAADGITTHYHGVAY